MTCEFTSHKAYRAPPQVLQVLQAPLPLRTCWELRSELRVFGFYVDPQVSWKDGRYFDSTEFVGLFYEKMIKGAFEHVCTTFFVCYVVLLWSLQLCEMRNVRPINLVLPLAISHWPTLVIYRGACKAAAPNQGWWQMMTNYEQNLNWTT